MFMSIACRFFELSIDYVLKAYAFKMWRGYIDTFVLVILCH